jgi:hypothetical protein
MPRRKKADEKKPDGEQLLRELCRKSYDSGYESAMRKCAFKLGLEKLGNPHGMLNFYRAMCVCYDIAAVERQFEFILKLNSWHEVFAAMEAADEAQLPETAASPISARTSA